MRLILIFCISLFSLSAFSQKDTTLVQRQAKDSINNMLQKELKVNKGKVDQILSTVDASIAKMNAIAKDTTIAVAEKIKRFKEIAADRDKKIGQQLAPDQQQKLQQIMTAGKEKRTQEAMAKAQKLKKKQ